MTPKTEQIQINLEALDFDKIHKTMKSLDWTWQVNEDENRVPTKEEIATMAEHCMNQALASPEKTHNAGGFEVEVIEGAISIKFVIDKADPLSQIFNG